MAEKKPKKKSYQQAAAQNTELINIHFYENQKRQALQLTTSIDEQDQLETGVGGSTDDNPLLSSVVTGSKGICDTAEALNKPECSPTSEHQDAVADDDDEGSSSVAISAPADKSRKGFLLY